MSDESSSRSGPFAWFRRRLVGVGLLLATVGLGWWGFATVTSSPPSTFYALYHTAQLFTLNLDLPDGVPPNWQLAVAAWLAPLLLLRLAAELFRDRLHDAARFFVRRQTVLFGAGESMVPVVRAARLRGWRRYWHALVVADLDQTALSIARDLGAWTVATDGLNPASLRKAAVPGSSSVVIMTDDDGRNAVIATEVGQLLAGRKYGRIFVSVRSPALVHTFDREDRPGQVETTPFSPSALAAVDVMDELDRRDGPLVGGNRVPSIVLFGQGPLVEAVLLDLRRREAVRLLTEVGRRPLRPQVLLVGPDAAMQLRRLNDLLGSGLDLLEIETIDDSLTQAAELDQRIADELLSREPGRTMVLAPDDLAGGTTALGLARRLGPDAKLALVTEGPDSTFGRHIAEQSTTDPRMSEVRVFRAPDLVFQQRRLEDQRRINRLARALHEAKGSSQPWSQVDEATRRIFRSQAEQLKAEIGLPLRPNAVMVLDAPQVMLLHELGVDDVTVFPRADLAPDLRDPEVLKLIGSRLTENDRPMAVDVWCEVARLATEPEPLNVSLSGFSARTGDIRHLLRLRRAQLGDANTKMELRAMPRDNALIGDVAVVLGEMASPELSGLIHWALTTLPYEGTFLAGEAGGTGYLMRDVAAADGITVRSLSAEPGRARRQILDLWTARLDAAVGSVRVLALPGDLTIWPLVQLFRALGAPVAWLPLGEDLCRPGNMLLGGDAGIVQLPKDRATVRAFLRPSRWPFDEATKDIVAAALHRSHARRQLAERPATDSVLRPFSQLLPAHQNAYRSIVDDIPTKLAVAGLHLGRAADATWPTPWPDPVIGDLLAEMEHGRSIAECLLRGQRLDTSNVGRSLPSNLAPWADLPEDYRRRDREIIADLPDALRAAQIGTL